MRKIFAVSDIHGCFTELKAALDEAGFQRNNPDHLLVCCGDYFDRGTENLAVLKYFDCLENKVLLRGNHEDMLLEVLRTGRMKDHNYLNGTDMTIQELFGKYCISPVDGRIDFSGKTRMLDRLESFILETKDYFETEKYVFVHGWLPTIKRDDTVAIDPNWRDASKEKWEAARWTKWTDMYGVCPMLQGKTIVCGHVPSAYAKLLEPGIVMEPGDIFQRDGLIVIDAGVVNSGKVSVLVVEE